MADVQSESLPPEPSKSAIEKSPKVLVNGEEVGDIFSDDDYQDAVSSHSEDEAEHANSGNNILRGHGSYTDNSHSENETKPSDDTYSPPSDELKEKIVVQVEHYLSDESLSRDAFLLKHVRRNKEGFVNLKLITSFKKVRSLTKDYRAVAEALKDSKLLSMNDELTKVRRNCPLPQELMERNPGRTVVATNLEDSSFEKVSEYFSKCGEIVLIRILRPGKTVPVDLKVYFSRHPELESEVCAVVEFETMAAAARACSELSKEEGMRVVELGKQAGKKEKKSKLKGEGHSDGGKDSDDEHDEKKKKKRRNKKNKRIHDLVNGSGDNSSGSSCASDSDSSYSPFNSCRRRYNSPSGTPDRQSPAGSPRGSPHTSPRPARKIVDNWRSEPQERRASPSSSPELQRRRAQVEAATPKKESNSVPNSPWSQRRKMASPNTNHSPNTSPLAASEGVRHRMVQLEGVNRLPKGPDGTRGFHQGIGRGRPLIQVA